MLSWGLDLRQAAVEVIGESFGKGWSTPCWSSRSACCTSCSSGWWPPAPASARRCRPTQQKLMQYLPVVFAVFLVFYLTGLVIYYMAQAIFRIGLQYYITHRFYKGEHVARSPGAARRRASSRDRQEGRRRRRRLFAQAKRELARRRAKPGTGARTARRGGRRRAAPPASVVDSRRRSAVDAAEEQADHRRPALDRHTPVAARSSAGRPKKK